MYKYAEIYGGKVRDLRESHLNFVEFCSIFDPTSFWLDVTGVKEVGIGWILKSNTEIGTYFEKPEALIVEDTLENRRLAKLEMLETLFESTEKKAYIFSSLGFNANAGQRAKNDVDGLIVKMEAENIEQEGFMDYDNVLQIVTLDEVKTIQLEIIKNGYSIYQQKWEMRNNINLASSIEELEDINIEFYMYDFLNNRLITPQPKE